MVVIPVLCISGIYSTFICTLKCLPTIQKSSLHVPLNPTINTFLREHFFDSLKSHTFIPIYESLKCCFLRRVFWLTYFIFILLTYFSILKSFTQQFNDATFIRSLKIWKGESLTIAFYSPPYFSVFLPQYCFSIIL